MIHLALPMARCSGEQAAEIVALGGRHGLRHR
jgi:hypothetical protein